MTAPASAASRGGSRWWIYQRERFPILGHGLLIAAFSLSAVCYSSLLRSVVVLPPLKTALVAFASSFLFFFQLRVSDEFKDAAEDARYRPYRPVPRGLVTLRELAWLGAVAALLQLLLAIWLHPPLAVFLAICWVYLALMGNEFFLGDRLRAHPAHYLWSHMLILPLIDVYITACDWLPAGGPPVGLVWLLVVSFSNGIVVEVGRKLRAPSDEEHGVETYSALWGRPTAVAVWLTAMLVTAVAATGAARAVGFTGPVGALMTVLLLLAVLCALSFLRRPSAGSGKNIEVMSGVWTLVMYCSVGVVPLVWRAFG